MSASRKRKQPIILIADPDEEERLLLRAIMKLVGFQVIEATNADQLVRRARRQPPDLLVVDLTLPRLNGAEGVDLIRRKTALPRLPVVAVALTKPRTRRPVTDSSTIFLPKPIEYERFYTLIDRFLPGQMTAFARSKCLPL